MTNIVYGQSFAIRFNKEKKPKSVFAINAGYLNPKDAEGGMMIGGSYSTSIDESVDIGFGFDIFHKSYAKESQVSNEDLPGLSSATYVTEVEFNRTIIPLMLAVNVKIPIAQINKDRDLYFGYFIYGGLGYEFLISKEKNYDPELNRKETRKYGGLGWQAAGGLFYDVGSRTSLIAAVFYNNSEVSRSIEESDKGLPVSERVSLAGFGFRVGVQMKIF